MVRLHFPRRKEGLLPNDSGFVGWVRLRSAERMNKSVGQSIFPADRDGMSTVLFCVIVVVGKLKMGKTEIDATIKRPYNYFVIYEWDERKRIGNLEKQWVGFRRRVEGIRGVGEGHITRAPY